MINDNNLDKTDNIDKTGKGLIVLVDDDSFLLGMYTLKFRKNGYEVMGFTDPQECVEKLQEGLKPDAIIFDVVMPGIDGWTFVGKIKDQALAPQSVFVVLSNQGQEADVTKSKELKVDGYIIKALMTPSEVVHKVEEYLK